MLLGMWRGRLSVVAVALGTMLLAAPVAEARIYDDPCSGPNATSINRPDGTILMCDNVRRIASEETLRLNVRASSTQPSASCPRADYKLGGTTSSYMDPLTAHWDYVAENAWTSWTGTGRLFGIEGYVGAYQPLVRNWWLGDGAHSVRYIQSCDRKPQSREIPGPGADDGVAVTGDAGPDDFDGTPEDDAFAGDGGDDKLAAGAGDDLYYAGAGDDEGRGGAGDDEILSGKGDDSVWGGPGADSLFDDEGNDDLRGGRGGDRFSAHDRTRDRIACGAGEDVVVADARDRITADCEHVFTSREDVPKRPPVQDRG